jgi:hypothetical protein
LEHDDPNAKALWNSAISDFEKSDYYMLVLRAQRPLGTWNVWILILFIIAACAIYRWQAASP